MRRVFQNKLISQLLSVRGCAVMSLAACMLLSGCARWSSETQPEKERTLSRPPLSPDTVLIETVFVRFPATDLIELQQMWRLTDESLLDFELRQRLDKNGFRAGVIVGDLPSIVRKRLERSALEQTTDALEYSGLAADVDNKMRQLRCRAGRRKDLLVRPELPDTLSVITTLNGRLSGATYERPTVLYDLRVIPYPNGQASVEIIPEIQHGDFQQTFTHTEFALRPQLQRKQAIWKDLAIECPLSPGQLLMVSSTQPPKSLGSAFFVTKTAEQTEEQVVLLIRLAATQLDELFEPELIEQYHALTEQ